jgi:hypothetical protein
MNYGLVKSLIGKDALTYNYDDLATTSFDDWCTITCHYTDSPVISDHTTGDSRDASAEVPEIEATHPTSNLIPANDFFKQGEDLAPNIKKYFIPPVTGNIISCIACHDPHGSDPSGETSPDKQMIRLHWTTSGAAGGLCRECHK